MKEYHGLPKWFTKQFKGAGNGSLLNVSSCEHYIGKGFDIKKKTWTDGSFFTEFERGLPGWDRYAADADFIVHFGRRL
jgi:hypothetical protein